MKRIFLIIISTFIVICVSAQIKNEESQPKLFQKIVFDVGAIPFSASIGDNPQMSSYNFALGYQVAKRLDIRINSDVYNLFETEEDNLSDFNVYERLLGLSIGANFNAFKGKNDSFLEKTSLGFVGKFGVGISPEYLEQESLFYDFSVRGYLSKVPYIGLGINHQIYGSSFKSNLFSFYLTFGFDF